MLIMVLIKECIKSSLTKLRSPFFLIFLFTYYSLSFLHLILAKRLKSNTLLFLIENTFFYKVYSDNGFPSLNFSQVHPTSPSTQLHVFFLSLEKKVKNRIEERKTKSTRNTHTNTYTDKTYKNTKCEAIV